jgi:hypothetical protein
MLLSAGFVVMLARQPHQTNALVLPPLPVEPAKETDVTGQTVATAKAFLATLDDAQRARVSLPFDSDLKTRWSNFPIGMVPRNGLRQGDLSAEQHQAVLNLLAVALSKRGLQKVKEIMDGDEVLRKNEAGNPGGPMGPGPNTSPGSTPPNPPPGGQGRPPRGMNPGFGRDNYYLAFFGSPSLTEPWMIQFGGHHLAINVTIVGKSNVMMPSLPAAQPAIYKLNGETVRPLGRENDKAFELINSLDATQQKQAILSYQVSDLVLGPGQDGKTVQPEGIKVSALTSRQQEKLLEVVNEWVGILNDEAAAAKMAEIKTNLAETWFAWSGPTTNGSAAYFRFQGPTLWIEYSPQRQRGSGGLDPTHIHTVYRDPTNDYGARLLKR